MYMYPLSSHKNSSNTMEKIRSNSWENLTQYYLLTCLIVVNVIVWEIGRRKQAAGPITRSGSSHVDEMYCVQSSKLTFSGTSLAD